MTRAEILDCLTDRPCDSCKFHESGRCERWNCVFEEKPDDCEDAISRQAAIDAAINGADDWDGGYNPTREEYIKKAINALPSVTPKQRMSFDGMTNGEVIQELFPNSHTNIKSHTVWVGYDAMSFTREWWNEPYKAENGDTE